MRTSAPSSIEGIEKYLASGMIRGIGPVFSVGSRGPAPKLRLFEIFNYILRQLYMKWKELPIARDDEGRAAELEQQISAIS